MDCYAPPLDGSSGDQNATAFRAPLLVANGDSGDGRAATALAASRGVRRAAATIATRAVGVMAAAALALVVLAASGRLADGSGSKLIVESNARAAPVLDADDRLRSPTFLGDSPPNTLGDWLHKVRTDATPSWIGFVPGALRGFVTLVFFVLALSGALQGCFDEALCPSLMTGGKWSRFRLVKIPVSDCHFEPGVLLLEDADSEPGCLAMARRLAFFHLMVPCTTAFVVGYLWGHLDVFARVFAAGLLATLGVYLCYVAWGWLTGMAFTRFDPSAHALHGDLNGKFLAMMYLLAPEWFVGSSFTGLGGDLLKLANILGALAGSLLLIALWWNPPPQGSPLVALAATTGLVPSIALALSIFLCDGEWVESEGSDLGPLEKEQLRRYRAAGTFAADRFENVVFLQRWGEAEAEAAAQVAAAQAAGAANIRPWAYSNRPPVYSNSPGVARRG